MEQFCFGSTPLPSHIAKIKVQKLNHLLLKLHPNPAEVFLYYFEAELREFKNLSVVMASEESLTVFLLHHIWSRFDVGVLAAPLAQFVNQLTPTKTRLLCGSDVEAFGKVKVQQHLAHQLFDCMKQIFMGAEKIPTVICVLCFRCSELVKSLPVSDVYLSEIGWVALHIFFKNALIPYLRSLVYLTGQSSPHHTQAVTFLSRFINKICCQSTFGNQFTLINNIIIDCSFLVNHFHQRIMCIAKDNTNKLLFPETDAPIRDEAIVELHQHLTIRGKLITNIVCDIVNREGFFLIPEHFRQGLSQPNELLKCFMKEISDTTNDGRRNKKEKREKLN
jgi:hypothetical protein